MTHVNRSHLLDADTVADPGIDDWRGQMARAICSREALEAQLHAKVPWTTGCAEAGKRFSMFVTPYYASLIRSASPDDPVFRMCVPDGDELRTEVWLSDDPLAERQHAVVPCLVHRYENRALVLLTARCAVHCRYCTRKRETALHDERDVDLASICAYLRDHDEISDVIISGGDPLVLNDSALRHVLASIRSVASVRIIRIHSRAPVVLPMRITDELCAILKMHHPLYINTHFNHPVELTPEARAACAKLADAGIPMGNQTVLLRGVNDSADVLAELCSGLLEMRVRPYYLHQCDLVEGAEHFRTSTATGIQLSGELRRRLGGMGSPVYAVDLPEAGCKIPLQPQYVVEQSGDESTFQNLDGKRVQYPEPMSG